MDRALDFEKFLNPRAIAVVGATDDIKRIGGQPIPMLVGGGYKGEIFPVNPNRDWIGERKCYPSVESLPVRCDVALILVPAKGVAEVVTACGRAGIPYAIVLSAGFGERGSEGVALQRQLVMAAEQANVRLVGPNCQGVINLKERVFSGFGTGFDESDAPRGTAALISQSGAMALSIMSRAKRLGIGFHYIVSSGNEATISSLDLLEYFLGQEELASIAMYLEGIKDGPRLLALGQRALELKKPIIVWKVGNSKSGREAAFSHTANVTASHAMYRAVFRQGGFVEVRSVDEMLAAVEAFKPRRIPTGRGVGIFATSGGFGVAAADACEERGLFLPAFSAATTAALNEVAPGFGSIANPIDLPGQMSPAKMNTVTPAVLSDPGVSQIILRRSQVRRAVGKEWAEGFVRIAADSAKPIHVTLNPDSAEPALAVLRASHEVSVYTSAADAREAVDGAAALADFADKIERHRLRGEVAGSRQDIELPDGKAVLGERAAKQVLSRYGIPTVAEAFVPASEVADLREAPLPFPVAVKLQSPDVHHKTEVGGVRLGIRSLEELKAAAAEISAGVKSRNPEAAIDGFLIQEMAGGIEVIVGVLNDEHFGPVVALGLGGIFTEVLRDVTHRLAPVDTATVKVMVEELRAAPLLQGVRGRPAADVEALADAVSRISRFAADHADRIAEIDVNPMFVRPVGEGVVAADALIVLKP